MKKDEGKAEAILSEETKPLRYTDFVKPNPFIKPWMEPYFPTNCYLRDLLAATVATTIALIFIWAPYFLFGNIGAVFGLLVAFVISVFVYGDIYGRYIAASAKFFREKNNANNSKTK